MVNDTFPCQDFIAKAQWSNFTFNKPIPKLEKILKGSLDSIPSPSEKIQIICGNGVKAKHCWVLSTNIWIQKVC